MERTPIHHYEDLRTDGLVGQETRPQQVNRFKQTSFIVPGDSRTIFSLRAHNLGILTHALSKILRVTENKGHLIDPNNGPEMMDAIETGRLSNDYDVVVLDAESPDLVAKFREAYRPNSV